MKKTHCALRLALFAALLLTAVTPVCAAGAPATGDETNLTLYIVLLAAAAAAMAAIVVVVLRRRR